MTSIFKPEFEFDEKTHVLSVKTPSLDAVRDAMIIAFARDVDGKMRQTLIDLGWTPPAGEPEHER